MTDQERENKVVQPEEVKKAAKNRQPPTQDAHGGSSQQSQPSQQGQGGQSSQGSQDDKK